MPDHMPNEERIKRELRRRPLTFAQRRKHLERLERAIAAGEDDMEFLKRRSRTEFGVLAAAITVILFGYVFWTAVLNESDSDDETPDLVAQAGATLTAREQTAAAQAPSHDPTTPPTIVHPTATRGQASAGTCQADPLATDLSPSIPRGDPSYTDWYGSREVGLWASPNNRAGYLPDIGLDPASLWFAGGATDIMWYGVPTQVQVTAERLDGEGVVGPIDSSGVVNQVYQWTFFTIPEPGCWSITGSTEGKSLTMTVEVLPHQQRPDVIYLEQLYAARPYEAPATCATTDLVGPEERFNYNIAHYWLDSNGVGTSVFDWFVAGEQQSLGVHGFDRDEDLTATAHNLDSRSGEVIEAMTSIGNAGVRIVRYTFPSPGCWEMELTTPTTTATYVVYVYPDDCLPSFENGEILVSCEPPQS